MEIKAGLMDFEALNKMVRADAEDGKKLVLREVNGQRYIGCGLCGSAEIDVYGTPGNDMAAFLNGPSITVYGNGQDQLGNTMNAGTVVVHGSVGDTAGYSMRGGEIFVKGSAGSRVGIHMKAYKEHHPVLVIGGSVGDFCGEYMAGGTLIVLGQGGKPSPITRYCASGIHGGKLVLRGEVSPSQIAREADVLPMDEETLSEIEPLIERWCGYFGGDKRELLSGKFTLIKPKGKNPFARLYTNNVY
ncbi:MAG: glutamate synthase [Eubacteriales bacterium]|nr:glutamate synthase [Eubacteriales bacterium]MDD3881977.1 glutamate synthase [Eubacteriales bacterium]MDD4513122.1 glutamate synthase [Eubacteriales bacterium]